MLSGIPLDTVKRNIVTKLAVMGVGREGVQCPSGI